MESVLRICAIAAAALVAASFLAFAVDQSRAGSQNQVDAIAGTKRAVSDAQIDRPVPEPAVERERERRHSEAREYIDDANDVLLLPFTGIVDSENVWAQRLVPGALGLLLYGLGGMLLANFFPKQRHEVKDWREATG